ncbi:putative E3 SUMO-protein ligase RNF212 isoform X2 [Mixophyes fleayi]|uniref:putative E3 SUMO-protein ligase RNF212 isoform X2 n=2 Tax=Mixophyes fleayi TaxID=3061075 RepID=UPI003F4DE151
MWHVSSACRKEKKTSVVCADHIAAQYFFQMRHMLISKCFSWILMYFAQSFQRSSQMGTSLLCFNMETVKQLYALFSVVEFQDSHRRRSIAHYKGKIAKLEETIKELTQQLENYSFRASQSYNRLPASGEFRTLGPTYSEKQTGVSPYSVPISRVPSAKTLEPMDFAPSAPKKKNFTIAGPTRLSLISPPQDGRMGHVPFRSNTAGSLRSAMGHSQPNVFHQLSQSISQTDRTSVLGSSSQRSTQIFPQTPLFTPSSGARQPITLANILQRRH